MVAKVGGNRKTLKIVLISFVALVVLFSLGSMAFVKNFYDHNFPRFTEKENYGYLRYRDLSGYPRTIVKFQSGGNTLTGYMYGENNEKGLVVIAPGLGEGAETFLPETVYFVDHGWCVFAFDYTGSFTSEGRNTVGLPQSRLDLEAALNYIQDNDSLSGLPILLYGHSWGGYAVTSILNDSYDITAVASIAGFNSPDELLAEQVNSQLGILGGAEYPFGWLYQTLRFGKDAAVSAVDGINHTDTPVMIIHGTADPEIAYDGASIIAQRNRITNPSVVYKTYSAENHNGHKNMYQSDAALTYIAEKNQEFQALNKQYDGNIPEEQIAPFYDGIDRFQTSELDASFMNAINDFFNLSLQIIDIQ